MVRMSDILRRIGIGAKPEPRKPHEEDKPKGDLKEESGKGASGGLSSEDRGKKAAEGGVDSLGLQPCSDEDQVWEIYTFW